MKEDIQKNLPNL